PHLAAEKLAGDGCAELDGSVDGSPVRELESQSTGRLVPVGPDLDEPAVALPVVEAAGFVDEPEPSGTGHSEGSGHHLARVDDPERLDRLNRDSSDTARHELKYARTLARVGPCPRPRWNSTVSASTP